jgi:hypothetical protein
MSLKAPTCYIASYSSSPMYQHLDEQHCPALLISFFYLWGIDGFRRRPVQDAWVPTYRDKTRYRHWILDSGAYSAWSTGATLTLDDYIAVAKDLWDSDPTLHEVFALDVITDWRQSRDNTERMWAAGIPAIPVYHIGEPEDVLTGYARDYPKIAIGGMTGLRGATKRAYVEQCFARVWPCPVHGLGLTRRDLLLAVPWHSVDASSCELGPRKFGQWRAYAGAGQGAAKLPVRGFYDLRPEVRFYLELENEMRWKWQREMVEVEARLTAAGWRGYV